MSAARGQGAVGTIKKICRTEPVREEGREVLNTQQGQCLVAFHKWSGSVGRKSPHWKSDVVQVLALPPLTFISLFPYL